MRTVISASRRTDIPAFYLEWFMAQLESGQFHVENPYNGKIYQVPANIDAVSTILLWSKNFGPFLAGRYGDQLEEMGYHLLFQFTINSESRLLEPQVPPLQERLAQVRELTTRFPAEAVTWRFDPICSYRFEDGPTENNLADFDRIAEAMAAGGIRRCVTSFVDLYGKVRRRLSRHSSLEIVQMDTLAKIRLLMDMESRLKLRGIELQLCCEKNLLELLPPESTIRQSSCVDHELIEDLYGENLGFAPDRGQRGSKGCGCMESRDIGSYRSQPCYHDCLFCYANPIGDRKRAGGLRNPSR